MASPPRPKPREEGPETSASPGALLCGDVAPAAPERTRVEIDVPWTALAKVGAALFAGWLLARVWPVILLLLIALMFVATFYPLVRRLQARVSRPWAITAVTGGVVLVIAVLLVVMIPPLVRQAGNIINELPEQARAVEAAARRAGIPLRVSAQTQNWMARLSSMGPEVLNVFATVLSGITGVLMVAVLTIYLLIDGPRVGKATMRLLPRASRLPVRRMLQEIADQVGAYIRGQLITSGLAGIFAYALLFLLGVPEPLALAFLMAVTDIIPIVGPLIGTAPAVLLALTQGVPTALAVLIGYTIYHQVESHFIVPKIYGGTMKLAPSIIVISMLVGATLMGIVGALLALPIAAAVPVILHTIAECRQRETDAEVEPDLPG